jgi:hypothetical protein
MLYESNVVGTDGTVRDLQETLGTIIGAFRETFDSRDILATWTANDETPTVTYTTNGRSGGVALQTGGFLWRISETVVPFDQSKLYRIQARFRKTAGLNGTTAFIGVVGVAADGITLVNIYGNDSMDDPYCVCAWNVNPGVSNDWVEYTGYFKGASSQGTHLSAPDPAAPAALHDNCRYFRPFMIVNWGVPTEDVTMTWPNGADIVWPDGTTEVDWETTEDADTWEIDEINIDMMPTWYDIRGDGRPADNADVTISQLAGHGKNLMPARYSSFEGRALPAMVPCQCTLALNPTLGYFGSQSLQVLNAAQNGWVYLSKNTSTYNVRVQPLKKWIVSARVRSNMASAAIRMYVLGNDGRHYYANNGQFNYLGDANEFHHYYGIIDLSSSAARRLIVGIESPNPINVATWWDGIMIEEYRGDGTTVTPSSFEPGSLGTESIGTDMIEDDGTTLEEQVEVESYDLTSYSTAYAIAQTSQITLYAKDKIRICASVEMCEFRTQIYIDESINGGAWTTRRRYRITDADQGGTVHYQRRAAATGTYQYRLMADTIATANNNLVTGISIDVIQVRR